MPVPPASAQPRAALVMLAAGEGKRVGHDTNKVLLPLAGRRVFTWAIRWAMSLSQVSHIVLVVRDADRDVIMSTLPRELPGVRITVVTGGESRHDSEWKALQALAPVIESGGTDIVVIHDAARPLAGARTFLDVIEAAARHGGALPVRHQPALTPAEAAHGAPPHDTVAVQTPQAFRAPELLKAYRRAHEEGFEGTDTASCVERYTDLEVRCVAGDAGNIKITFPEDLFLAERLLAKADWDLSLEHDQSARGRAPR